MKLSVCIATCQDAERLKFTVQALKMYHPICSSKECEFIVFDNTPKTKDGEEVKKFIESRSINGKYFGFSSPQSSWNKYKTIPFADGEIILGLDSHVLLQEGAVQTLVGYFDANPESKDLIQGQLLYDSLESGPTKLDHKWGSGMLGVWADPKPIFNAGINLEVNMMGMGLWAIRKKAWKGISPYFRGFGSEEYTIHRYIKHWGGKTIILGGFGWWHDFGRVKPPAFKISNEDRIFNYFIGAFDVYKTEDHPFFQEVKDYFATENVSQEVIERAYQEAKSLTVENS